MDWDGLVRALIALGVAVLGVYSHRSRRELRQVHVLVNSNLAEIKARLAAMTAERDTLAAGADNDPAAGRHRPAPGP